MARVRLAAACAAASLLAATGCGGDDAESPGIPRPLTKPAHYERFRGREADVRLHAPLDGHRRIRGEVLESDDRRVVLRDQEGVFFEIPFAAISRAHLVEEL